tara:strand:- start:367 stop:540 length:174 start_codon:yes stop_codon:yes gene_type:complete
MKKNKKYYRVETDHFQIDFESKKVYKHCLKHADLLGVNFDHYMLEFNILDGEVCQID